MYGIYWVSQWIETETKRIRRGLDSQMRHIPCPVYRLPAQITVKQCLLHVPAKNGVRSTASASRNI